MCKVSVIVRSHNDMPLVRQAFAALKRQKIDGGEIELVCIDNQSSDGTAEFIAAENQTGIILHWPEADYTPGRVLNEAFHHCSGDYVVFNNADSIPQSDDYLAKLIAPLVKGRSDIVFAQQVPRPNARPLVRKDYERAFGNGKISMNWRHFFSLAGSGTTRAILKKYPFREELQYSEDVEWSRRVVCAGGRMLYVPEAAVEHSHNYTPEETAKRFYNEGVADALIFGDRPRLFRGFLLPMLREMLRDLRYLAQCGALAQMPGELRFRFLQRYMHYRGCGSKTGWKRG